MSKLGIGATAGLLLLPSCITTPFAHVTLTLGQTGRDLCGLQHAESSTGSAQHGDTLLLRIDNNCVGPKWLGVHWEGQTPFESCHDFPIGRPFPVPEGVSWASCIVTSGPHCSRHQIFVQVRDSENFEVPASVEISCRERGSIKNHSLDFSDVPP